MFKTFSQDYLFSHLIDSNENIQETSSHCSIIMKLVINECHIAMQKSLFFTPYIFHTAINNLKDVVDSGQKKFP